MNRTFKKCIQSILLIPLAPLFAHSAYVGGGSDPTLSVVNTIVNEVEGEITLGVNSVLMAITPDNQFAYVTTSSNSVAVIDLATNTLDSVISLPAGSDPVGIAITPDGRFAYVANIGNSTVSIISIANNQLLSPPISNFDQPWGIAITPNGKFAYVVNLFGGFAPGYVSIIDLSSNTLLPDRIQVENGPTDIAILPNGQYAYVTNENSNSVSVISTTTNQQIKNIPVGINPFELTTSPDSKSVYVSNNAYTNMPASSISVISTDTQDVIDTIDLGLDHAGPADLAITSDGEKLYVTNTIDIAVIDTESNAIVDSVDLSNRSAIALTAILVTNAVGWQAINDFGMVYEYFNHLEWEATPYSNLRGFNIYRNGKIIATVSADTFEYNDHNQKKGVSVTYMVAPIEASGQEGTPLPIIVN